VLRQISFIQSINQCFNSRKAEHIKQKERDIYVLVYSKLYELAI